MQEKKLCISINKYVFSYFAAFLLTVALVTVSIALERSHYHTVPDETDILYTDTTADIPDTTDTQTASETAETVPVIPYYTAENDSVYHPAAHMDEVFVPKLLFHDTHRIYAAIPDTGNEVFDARLSAAVDALINESVSNDCIREGGETVITIDYTLTSENSSSSVLLTKTVTDTVTAHTNGDIRVVYFDTAAVDAVSPLEIYDLSAAGDVLYREVLNCCAALLQTNTDDARLAQICGKDASAVSEWTTPTASDNTIYFHFVIGDENSFVVHSCPVSRDMISSYTWEALKPKPPVYISNGALPESPAVTDDYFDDALFIGNSLVVALQKVYPLNSRFFATVGLNILHVFSKEIVTLPDGTVSTIYDALSALDYNKVYLMFGINELGFGTPGGFILYYNRLIDQILASAPHATVYVQSIIPIHEEKATNAGYNTTIVNNTNITSFNQALEQMCRDKGVCFVDVYDAFADANGSLPAKSTPDGIHLNTADIYHWMEYLKTHTYK